MRKYWFAYAVLCALLLAGLLLAALMPAVNPGQEIDFIAINELTRQAAAHWHEPSALDSILSPYRFVLLDSGGDVRHASHEGLPDSLTAALRRGFVPMDITEGASVIGKALVEAPSGDAREQFQNRQRALMLAAFALLCVLNAAFLWALHAALVQPFKRLEAFAHTITTGRFDEPLPMDRHNIFGLFTQSFDVMRASLREARRKQREAEQAKKELIASLSHDMKTPVTSIRLISELLQAQITDPVSLEKLKTIEQKADQLDRLMNNLLHSALEELGELSVTVSSEDSGIIRGLFEDVNHFSRIRVSEIPACLVELDRARMEQVIGNIIANSYKYAETYIDVDCTIHDELLQIDVNDYGPGVEPEELELITTKFYRGERAKASQKEGEGLGLYIAKLLMEKMGGGLEALNCGDGFTLRLWMRLSR